MDPVKAFEKGVHELRWCVIIILFITIWSLGGAIAVLLH